MVKQAVNKERVCVYDIITDGELVYVGITNKPDVRMNHHKSTGIAQKRSSMIVVEWHDTRRGALDAERKRIKELKPPLNMFKERRVKEEFDWKAWRKDCDDAIDALSPEDIAALERRYKEQFQH